jgi:hypothetical protein
MHRTRVSHFSFLREADLLAFSRLGERGSKVAVDFNAHFTGTRDAWSGLKGGTPREN